MCVRWDYAHQDTVLETRMETVLGLVVLLAASSHGLGSMCDATQNATCYAALGGPVYLQLMGNATGHEVKFSFGGHSIFRFRGSQTMFYKEYSTSSVLQRWQFVPENGTLIINPAERRDLGTYKVLTFDTVGRVLGDYKVHLITEVSDVKGELACSVRNHVSSTQTSGQLVEPCSGVSPVFICVWLAEIIILTSILGGNYLYIRNKTSHTPDEREPGCGGAWVGGCPTCEMI